MEYNSTQGPQDVYPQVLLLGNGLNRAFGGESWGGLIKNFWKNDSISHENPQVAGIPFPLQVVLGTKDAVDAAIRENRAALCCLRGLSALRAALEPVWNMGFDHILTTNYSYELECAADPALEARLCPQGKCLHKKCPFKAAMRHTSQHAETKYLLHTYNAVVREGREQKIWHIHGEARKPESVILGHYLYGKLLQNYDKHLSARADEQRERQQNGQPPLLESWLDRFHHGRRLHTRLRQRFFRMGFLVAAEPQKARARPPWKDGVLCAEMRSGNRQTRTSEGLRRGRARPGL